jgi:hypothetical protein
MCIYLYIFNIKMIASNLAPHTGKLNKNFLIFLYIMKTNHTEPGNPVD